MASRFTFRFGRSLRDYERAKELTIRPELAKKLEEELKFARELAGKTLKLRGPDFTLDQLIEQEDLFQDGLHGNIIMKRAQIECNRQAARWLRRAIVQRPLVCEKPIPFHIVVVGCRERGMMGHTG